MSRVIGYPLQPRFFGNTGGAFIEPCDGGIVLFSSPEKAQEFVDKDPYYTAGLVTSYKVRDLRLKSFCSIFFFTVRMPTSLPPPFVVQPPSLPRVEIMASKERASFPPIRTWRFVIKDLRI